MCQTQLLQQGWYKKIKKGIILQNPSTDWGNNFTIN
jgi:hypothetical protein